MKNKLKKVLQEEDYKNPLTDEECAKKLKITRSEITQLRQSLTIPDSRERRKPYLLEDIRKIIVDNKGISERNLTALLNKQGYKISRFSVSGLLKEIAKNHSIEFCEKESDAERVETDKYEDPFSGMIGWNKSLRVKIEKAKAAVLYPPNGLHTLIVGATGVGKSELAEAMYQFALQTRNKTAAELPLVVFNCADYAENPQLLIAQLFGYKKGAFTGADNDREGLVDKADGGILFLDEVHRLPPDGQEILFQLIDKGTYRRLGETSVVRKANVMIIAATTEDIEKNLLGTFRRRIPMIIELPPLNMRPIKERYDIIRAFFQKEATRINKEILVKSNVVRTFLIYDCHGNIGQLRSDIQVACARSFLSYVSKGSADETIVVEFGAIPAYVSGGILNIQWNRIEVEKVIMDDLYLSPVDCEAESDEKSSLYSIPDEIYRNIEEEYQKLLNQGFSTEVINRIIGDDLETKLKKIIKHVEKNKNKLNRRDLRTIVNPEVINLVNEMLKVAKNAVGEIDDTLFYCLATHLNSSLERIKKGKPITNPQLANVKQNYPHEFKIATEMAALTSHYLNYELPEEEIGFIAMYLRTLANYEGGKDTIGIVVISHGNVAEGMASVANRLLGVDIVKAVEMSLDEKPEIAYERTLEIVISANRGKGVLLLVDMGSLSGFGNFITTKTGIITRTITRVDTMMIIDAVRKVLLPEADINEIADSLIKGKKMLSPIEDIPVVHAGNPVVISLCLTGEGTAKQVSNLIQNIVSSIDKGIKILTLGMLDEKSISEQIEKIKQKHFVMAIVGTIDPVYFGIPFISAASIVSGEGLTNFKELLRDRYQIISRANNINYKDKVHMVFNQDIVLINKEVKHKQQAIKLLVDAMLKKGYITANYYNGIMDREAIGSTAVGNGLAIPHGNREDIIVPSVGVLVLKNPVLWDETNKVSLVFMLGLNEHSKHEFQRVYRIIKNPNYADKIRKASDVETVISILTEAKI